MENMLVLQAISKKVRGKYLIRDVSIQVEKGTICGLLGPNGAGKTTIIRMLTGLIRPTTGDIVINEQSVVKNRESALKNVGAIVESPIFFPYMTGRENLKNLVRLHDNIPKREANDESNQRYYKLLDSRTEQMKKSEHIH